MRRITCDKSPDMRSFVLPEHSAGNHIERQLYEVSLCAKWFRVRDAIAELAIKERSYVKR